MRAEAAPAGALQTEGRGCGFLPEPMLGRLCQAGTWLPGRWGSHCLSSQAPGSVGGGHRLRADLGGQVEQAGVGVWGEPQGAPQWGLFHQLSDLLGRSLPIFPCCITLAEPCGAAPRHSQTPIISPGLSPNSRSGRVMDLKAPL